MKPLREDAGSAEEIRAAVREGFTRLAGRSGACCGSTSEAGQIARHVGYSEAELEATPEGANLGVGCGNPLALVVVRPGSAVLDLGSGAGFDALLAARVVGPEGQVIGVDMTEAMVDRARSNAARAGLSNVEFREGLVEALPVADASVDVVISNCVINLVPDKRQAFREAFRVLRPGGRLAVSDVVLTKPLPRALQESAEAYVGCIGGASLRDDYLDAIRAAGFQGVEVRSESSFGPLARIQTPEILVGADGDPLSAAALEEALKGVMSMKVTAEKPAIDCKGSEVPTLISRQTLRRKIEAGSVLLLDAQAPGWYEREHLPGALKMPEGEGLERKIRELAPDPNTEIVVYCWSEACTASGLAAETLESLGYRNVQRYAGGKRDWIEGGLPVVPGSDASSR